MPAVCKELIGLTLAADAKAPGGTTRYVVTGTSDPAEAQASVLAAAPTFATLSVPADAGYSTGTVYRLKNDLREVGGGVWFAEVSYGLPDAVSVENPATVPPGTPAPPQPSSQPGTTELGPEFSFSTTGGTAHVTQSKGTKLRKSFDPNLAQAPSHQRAIGVSRDRVEGTDVVVGRIEWQVTVRKPAVTHEYVKTLARLTGTVSDGPFFGYDEEELLFVGASGQFRPGDGWHVTYQFHAGVTRDLPITESYSMPNVAPFDHVWVVYAQGTSGTAGVQTPLYAYQERVYEKEAFSQLGI